MTTKSETYSPIKVIPERRWTDSGYRILLHQGAANHLDFSAYVRLLVKGGKSKTYRDALLLLEFHQPADIGIPPMIEYVFCYILFHHVPFRKGQICR